MFVLFRSEGNSGVCLAASPHDGLLGGASVPVNLSLGVQVQRLQNCNEGEVGDELHDKTLRVVLDSVKHFVFLKQFERLKAQRKYLCWK